MYLLGILLRCTNIRIRFSCCRPGHLLLRYWSSSSNRSCLASRICRFRLGLVTFSRRWSLWLSFFLFWRVSHCWQPIFGIFLCRLLSLRLFQHTLLWWFLPCLVWVEALSFCLWCRLTHSCLWPYLPKLLQYAPLLPPRTHSFLWFQTSISSPSLRTLWPISNVPQYN